MLCSGSSAFLVPSSGRGSTMVSVSVYLLRLLVIMLPRGPGSARSWELNKHFVGKILIFKHSHNCSMAAV